MIFFSGFSRSQQVKKVGKKADMTEFRAQLDSIGVKIVEVTADGQLLLQVSDRLLVLGVKMTCR